MIKYSITALLASLLCLSEMQAQQSPDTLLRTPLQAFKKGTFQGQFRTFFMATDNSGALSDYHAWALGGSLHFKTAAWHHFSAGIGGVFNFNLNSSDLGKKDSITGAVNRYEIGLFDVENPYNRNDLDRLQELWLKYRFKSLEITLGKQSSLQTPFINPQDGRMRSTAVEGLWTVFQPDKDTRIEGGWLYKISPRSTVKWYSIGQSIGIYPRGLNPDGSASGYPEHLKSAGIGMLGISRQWNQYLRARVWETMVDNIFNTVLLQCDLNIPINDRHTLMAGAQYTHQNSLHEGGNPDASKAYFPANSQSNVFSFEAGWQYRRLKSWIAYTRITADGRFLSPREWGREPFYTFISRERMEGSGNSKALSARVNWTSSNQRIRLETAFGVFHLPDIKDPAMNKYAFPSFNQFNADVRYALKGMLQGMEVEFLYVRKGRLGNVYDNMKYVINRVDMSQYNLVVNYSY